MYTTACELVASLVDNKEPEKSEARGSVSRSSSVYLFSNLFFFLLNSFPVYCKLEF